MKPHEESWDAVGNILGRDIGTGTLEAVAHFDQDRDYPKDEARAKLAAQAPAMARLLLTEYEREKRACFGKRLSLYGEALETVLREAGVLP